ncbi:hypothetical protein C349_02367 [Cryptococcus neoformans var. grubii Br795]|nr:hypothetical protein C353_02345 [Cryptococcus neoformans var. grubii AD1-83a]OWZ55127.1 hypothetical protein C368_02932 [Cryptococcus neoformans var. grubii 125.91]OXG48469.1 hypothetical protein C355_04417 [Cryptococcus neoformans var. grubii Th84]OXG63157.1 hypothetical protein C354_02282 [Cryptococcus neoformans var. grubii MW-RSA1955]OXG66232.1 hypothetical protein C351_01940 [Cryptococcus neoformans var. grubii c8]OXG68120.1 hypothetical protein C352_02286 [Cryptococcus neoformans var.
MYPTSTSLCFNQYDWDYTSKYMSCEDFLFTDDISPSKSSIEAEETDLVNTVATPNDNGFVNTYKYDSTVDAVLQNLTPSNSHAIKGYIMTWVGKGDFLRGEIPFRAYHKVVVVLPYGQYPITQEDEILAFRLASNLRRRIMYRMYARYRCQKHYRLPTEIEAAKLHLAIEAKKLLQKDAFAGFVHVSFGDRHLMSRIASTAYKPKVSYDQRCKIARTIDCEVGGSRTWAELEASWDLERFE